MRFVVALFIFLFAASAGFSQSDLRKLNRVSVSGTDYVKVKDWADSLGLTLRWTKRDEELLATNKFCSVALTVKSQRSLVNGIDVRLAFPVILRNGAALVAMADLQATIHPLLFPRKNPAGEKIKVICLDPGHGGSDTGKIDKTHHEKRYTLLLAEEMNRLLKQNGFKVISTRYRDETLKLSERALIANRQRADLFISLHFNSADNKQVRGAETYCMTPAGLESSNAGGGKSSADAYSGNGEDDKNILLAYMIQRSLVRNLGMEDRGVKRARFDVLRSAKMPAVLIEGGFMSNALEAKKIYDPEFRKRMARAIVDGILAYQKTVEASDAAGK